MKKYPKIKNRRDIGEVVFPIEKLNAAREISSCCVGTEVYLETDTGLSETAAKSRNSLKNIWRYLMNARA